MAGQYSFKLPLNRAAFFDGVKSGLPIGLGYFVVAFSLGVAARGAGLSAFQGGFASALCSASAGEYAGFTVIAADASYFAIVLATLVANARYLLMGCAIGQKASPKLPLLHRCLVAFDLTDEIFGVTIARPGFLNPWFNYGAMVFTIPLWTIGTVLGIVAGNLLSPQWVSALSVTLFGMFIAVIVPPCRQNKVLGGLVFLSFLLSYLFSIAPYLSKISEGTKTIVLTLVLASIAALVFPVKQEADEHDAASAPAEETTADGSARSGSVEDANHGEEGGDR